MIILGEGFLVMAARKIYRATKPERILDMAEEARYFLSQMVEHDKSDERIKFLHSLGAFLKSFRSIAYRLYGVVEARSGDMKALEKLVKTHPRVGFLIEQSNAEVHGDGVAIWRKVNLSIAEDMHDAGSSRWNSRRNSRWGSRFTDANRWHSRFAPKFRMTTNADPKISYDWQFSENSASLFDLCRKGLEEMLEIVQQNT